MHSVCPQIRPAAFNRFGCDFLFSLAWQTAQTASPTPSPPAPPYTQPPAVQSAFFFPPRFYLFFSPFPGWVHWGREEKKEGKKEGGQRAMFGEKKERAPFNLCRLRLAMIGRQLCASRTKCCLRTLAHRWLVTSVADTSERSLQKIKKTTKNKNKKNRHGWIISSLFPFRPYFLYELWRQWKKNIRTDACQLRFFYL